MQHQFINQISLTITSKYFTVSRKNNIAIHLLSDSEAGRHSWEIWFCLIFSFTARRKISVLLFFMKGKAGLYPINAGSITVNGKKYKIKLEKPDDRADPTAATTALVIEQALTPPIQYFWWIKSDKEWENIKKITKSTANMVRLPN